MYKAIGYWTWPNDIGAFEEHYRSVHVPLAQALPKAQHVATFKADDSGRESDIYRFAEIGWADKESFEEAMGSEAWSAMAEDAAEMIERFGVQMHAAMGWDDEPHVPSQVSGS